MARKVIVLFGDPRYNEEDAAAEAIIPGHLVTYDGSGNLIKNTTAAVVSPAFALERDEMGDDIDTPYAIGDTVKVGVFHKGLRAYVWLASGQNVAKGDYLAPSTTAGLLTKAGVTTTLRIARALEAVDTSGSAPVAGTRIRVEIV
jgi:hypothetical protein